MPRYTPNQTNASATFTIFPKDQYEFVIGEPKPFETTKEKDGVSSVVNHGIRYTLTCVSSGAFNGKKYIKTCYMHSAGSEDMTKQFMQAAHGFEMNSDGEAQFNDKILTLDQSYDPETGEVGDYWSSIKGGRILGVLEPKMYENKEQNSEKGWSPLS